MRPAGGPARGEGEGRGDAVFTRRRQAARLLLVATWALVSLGCTPRVGAGLNHFRRNGQLARKKLAHSSIVNALNHGRVRQMRAAADLAWDAQLYPEGRSIVDDEDPIAAMLMSRADGADHDHRSSRVIVAGKVHHPRDRYRAAPPRMLRVGRARPPRRGGPGDCGRRRAPAAPV
jgi:hypothetical protein